MYRINLCCALSSSHFTPPEADPNTARLRERLLTQASCLVVDAWLQGHTGREVRFVAWAARSAMQAMGALCVALGGGGGSVQRLANRVAPFGGSRWVGAVAPGPASPTHLSFTGRGSFSGAPYITPWTLGLSCCPCRRPRVGRCPRAMSYRDSHARSGESCQLVRIRPGASASPAIGMPESFHLTATFRDP